MSKIQGRDISELTVDWSFVAAYLDGDDSDDRKATLEILAELRRSLNS